MHVVFRQELLHTLRNYTGLTEDDVDMVDIVADTLFCEASGSPHTGLFLSNIHPCHLPQEVTSRVSLLCLLCRKVKREIIKIAYCYCTRETALFDTSVSGGRS